MNIKQQFTSAGSVMHGLRFTRPEATRTRRSDDRAQRFGTAMLMMEEGRWQQAFAHLAALADGGHPQAARIAMLFVRRGAVLFGGSFHASPLQRECWLRAGE